MIYPVTFNQERRLVLEEYLQNRGVKIPPFHIQMGMELEGPVNLSTMERALNGIIDRHSALRTAFRATMEMPYMLRKINLKYFGQTGIAVPGMYIQHVYDDVKTRIEVKNVHKIEADRRKQHVRDILDHSLLMPFDYNAPPFMRAFMVEIRKNVKWLILVINHLIADMWSVGILLHELISIYCGEEYGISYSLNPINTPFHEYAMKQRLLANGNGFNREMRYWASQWDYYEEALLQRSESENIFSKGLDKSSVESQSKSIVIGYESLMDINREASRFKMSAYVIFLSSMMLVLSKYTKRKKIALMVNCANRATTDVQHTIGWFATTHILGVEFGTGDKPRDIYCKIKESLYNLISHQSMPTAVLRLKSRRKPLKSDFMVVCDYVNMIPRGRSDSSDDASKVKFKPLTIQDLVVPKWISGLNITFVKWKDNVEVIATYSNSQISRAGFG